MRQIPRETLSSVGKKVGVFPAGQVEFGSRRKEVETGFGQSRPAFARQHSVEYLFQSVQKRDVIRRVRKLLFAELSRSPVGALLLLRKINAQKILHQILEAMSVGVGPNKFRRELGAIDGRSRDSQVVAEDCDIESCKMEKLGDRYIGKKPLQIGRCIRARGELYEMRRTISRRELNKAEPVARWTQSQRFAVDRNKTPEIDTLGKIAFVEFNLQTVLIMRP